MSKVSEDQEMFIKIWSKAVDTQMHFNEMCVKSRQLGLTFVAGALGVAIVLLSRGQDFSFSVNLFLFTLQLHVAVLLILGAWLALQAVKGLDLNVYHKMLRGAVTFGEDFEEHYMKKIFDLDRGMTQAISHFSRYKDAKVTTQENGRYLYEGHEKASAEKKIKDFYRRTGWFLLLGAGALFLITNLTFIAETIADPEREASRLENLEMSS